MIAFPVRGYFKKAFFFLLLIVSTVILSGSLFKPVSIFAQAATQTPTPTVEPSPTNAVGPNVAIDAQWAFDPETTEVGKNADRARQLIWWVLSHPPVHWAPVLATVWAYSRNIMYVFIVIVIVMMGLGIILSRRGSVGPIFSGISSPTGGINITGILYKLGVLLIYVTFSYVFILGMIQISEVIMRFFIDNVGGKDLFNVIFFGSGNSEANYTTFIGYRDINPINQEMANTSLFLIRTTSLTYYAMSIILILRTVILWFLMIVSPFLALLMPFIFIRNTGWIWIGVFFQWLFYGPLMILFLSAMTRIWVAGIPFMFDFSRVGKPDGQVYRTAINILYGGPAQTLGPGNTANYVDTFAEYVIALVMLWAAIILPWWLLRIFRDYCCSLLASANATMQSILDRMRQYPPPSPSSPVSPTTISGMATELPFRQHIEERVKEFTSRKVAEVRSVKLENTADIVRSIDMAVSSLADISRMEMDQNRRVQVKDNLNKIASPEKITSPIERQKYTNIKTALQSKAAAGDVMAKTILNASQGDAAISSNIEMMVSGRSSVASVTGRRGVFAPTAVPSVLPVGQSSASGSLSQSSMVSISKQVGLSETKVMDILSGVQSHSVPAAPTANLISQRTGLTETKVREVMDRVRSSSVLDKSFVSNTASQLGLSEEKIKEVVQIVSTGSTSVSREQQIKSVAEKTGVAETKIMEVMDRVGTSGVLEKSLVSDIAAKSSISEEKVKEVVHLMSTKTVSTKEQIIKSVADKTGVSEEKVKEVMQASMIAQGVVKGDRKETAARIANANIAPVKIAGSKVETQVSVEDYEEVKKMWLNHYREAPVPESEILKTRDQWITTEERTLSNISNLLVSVDPKQKQKGLEQVAEILPFMLLGGFSDVEVLTYIKAKLEALKQVQTELEMTEKAKADAKKEMKDQEKEEEDTLLTVTDKKKEEEKHMEESKAQEMDMPSEEKSQADDKTK